MQGSKWEKSEHVNGHCRSSTSYTRILAWKRMEAGGALESSWGQIFSQLSGNATSFR